MAVYTKLTHQEIANFLKQNYTIGDLVSFKEIIDGIDNSNFIIQTNFGKFILTIFESRIIKDELPFFMNLKLHLAQRNIRCAKPINNNSNSLISAIKNKPAAIVSFLDGKTLNAENSGLYSSITVNHCKQIGKTLANLHNAVIDFEGYRKNDLGVLGWRNLFNKISHQIESYQDGLKQELEAYIEFVENNWVVAKTLQNPDDFTPHQLQENNLSQGDFSFGAIHADLFPDNVFFDKKSNVSGVIDFYFAANDLFIYDVAIIINAWCFDQGNQFSEEKCQAILQSYKEVINLSIERFETELKFLKVALVGASLRFLLTRLHDLFFTTKDSLVKVKNPQEYLQKIRYFYGAVR